MRSVRAPPLPRALRAGQVVVSTLLFAAAFPPWGLASLAWVALVPLFVALRRAGRGEAVLLAWLWSLLAAYWIGTWMPRAVATYYAQPQLLGVAFFLGCVTTMAAPYYGAFALLYRRIAAAPGAAVPFLAAAAWVACELGRGRLFTGTPFFIGNPWGLIGYSQAGRDRVVQIAAATGIYGVSFVIAAANAALAEAVLARRVRPGRLAAAFGPTAFALAVGWAVLPAGDPDAGRHERVAVVQPNLDLGSTWDPAFYGRNLDTSLRLTRATIEAARPRVVFWPEGAMTFLLEREPAYRAALGSVLGPSGTELVAGGPSADEATAPPAYRNSIFAIRPDGEVAGRYDKQYLVPFAEYFPLRQLDFLRRRFERVRVFTPGAPSPPLPTAVGPAGVLTCNEGMLPEVAAARVADGAAYLVNPSNDTWTADATYSALEFDIVAMRAVEQRRWLVRASTAGPSAIVDPWGRVRARTAPGSRDTLAGPIAARTGRTVYGRIGDAFAVACALAALAAALWPSGRGPRPATR